MSREVVVRMLLALAREFSRIEERAVSYSGSDLSLAELSDGNPVTLRTLRLVMERAFIMGYSTAITDAMARAAGES